MSSDGAYVLSITHLTVLVAQKNVYNTQLMKLSSEKNLKCSEFSNKIDNLTAEQSSKTEALWATLPEDYTSDQYLEIMNQVESLSNDYTAEIQILQNQMSRIEENYDSRQEVIETKLEVIDAEIDEWKECKDEKAKANGYFD